MIKKLTLLLALSLGLTSMAFAQEGEVTVEVVPSMAPNASVEILTVENPPFMLNTEESVLTEAEVNAQMDAQVLELNSQPIAGVEAQSGVAVNVVITNPQVATYMQGFAAMNEGSGDVNVLADGKISMTIQDTGKLFGFFSVQMEKNVYVESTSENEVKVTVKKPWWAFLATEEAYADLETELETNINASLQA